MYALRENSVDYMKNISHMKNNSSRNHIVPFLIGSTGFIGKVTLERLLCVSHVKHVFVLIRSKKGQSIKDRFEEMSQSACFASCKSDFTNGRIVPFEGDICQSNLGLKPNDYRRITSEVTHIINLAASVNFSLSIF